MKTYLTISTLAFAGCATQNLTPAQQAAVDKLTKASISYKGRECPCVVGDVGPRSKLGEASPAAAEAVGINGDPNTGGIDTPRVLFEIWPGVPAQVNGVIYQLQPYAS